MAEASPHPPPETKFIVPTGLGDIWLWGRDTGRPVILIITGAFAEFDYLEDARRHFPDADVIRAHLPGNHGPELATISIGAFAFAFSEAIARFGNRPIAVVGVSTGALVALALRAAGVGALLLIEPPLRSDLLWPFENMRDGRQPGWERVFWPIYGFDATRREPRSYEHLLAGLRTPTLALVADTPLMPPRRYAELPSLVDDASRALLESHPSVELRIVPGTGHDIPGRAGEATVRAIRQVLAQACRAQG